MVWEYDKKCMGSDSDTHFACDQSSASLCLTLACLTLAAWSRNSYAGISGSGSGWMMAWFLDGRFVGDCGARTKARWPVNVRWNLGRLFCMSLIDRGRAALRNWEASFGRCVLCKVQHTSSPRSYTCCIGHGRYDIIDITILHDAILFSSCHSGDRQISHRYSRRTWD